MHGVCLSLLSVSAQGSKGSKGSKGSAKAAAKEELYIDADDGAADVKPDSKGSGGPRSGSKVRGANVN